jgi:hypothetical protein
MLHTRHRSALDLIAADLSERQHDFLCRPRLQTRGIDERAASMQIDSFCGSAERQLDRSRADKTTRNRMSSRSCINSLMCRRGGPLRRRALPSNPGPWHADGGRFHQFRPIRSSKRRKQPLCLCPSIFWRQRPLHRDAGPSPLLAYFTAGSCDGSPVLRHMG